MDGRRKRGRSRNDEAEGDLQTLRRIIIWHTVAPETGRNGWGTVLDAKVHNGLECLRNRE
jgi:hypothetical protein